jgi:hypothetical protein
MWGGTFSNTKKKRPGNTLHKCFFKNQKAKGGFASYNPITCTLQSLTKEKEKER